MESHFDNYPLAEYMDPPLTVVDIDTYKLGEKKLPIRCFLIQNRGTAQEKEEVLLLDEIIERNLQ